MAESRSEVRRVGWPPGDALGVTVVAVLAALLVIIGLVVVVDVAGLALWRSFG